MGPNLISEFNSMMVASYGDDWQESLQPAQKIDMQRAFMGGVVATLSHIPLDVQCVDPLRQQYQQCQQFLQALKESIDLSR